MEAAISGPANCGQVTHSYLWCPSTSSAEWGILDRIQQVFSLVRRPVFQASIAELRRIRACPDLGDADPEARLLFRCEAVGSFFGGGNASFLCPSATSII